MIKGVLTIVFDDPFYKAIFERFDSNNYYVAQVNLGASMPHMPQILNLVNLHYSELKFYRETNEERVIKHINPKKAQRLAHKATKTKGIGTKAQQALKKQFEEEKAVRKVSARDKKRDQQRRRFLLKQEKRREKHKGH